MASLPISSIRFEDAVSLLAEDQSLEAGDQVLIRELGDRLVGSGPSFIVGSPTLDLLDILGDSQGDAGAFASYLLATLGEAVDRSRASVPADRRRSFGLAVSVARLALGGGLALERSRRGGETNAQLLREAPPEIRYPVHRFGGIDLRRLSHVEEQLLDLEQQLRASNLGSLEREGDHLRLDLTNKGFAHFWKNRAFLGSLPPQIAHVTLCLDGYPAVVFNREGTEWVIAKDEISGLADRLVGNIFSFDDPDGTRLKPEVSVEHIRIDREGVLHLHVQPGGTPFPRLEVRNRGEVLAFLGKHPLGRHLQGLLVVIGGELYRTILLDTRKEERQWVLNPPQSTSRRVNFISQLFRLPDGTGAYSTSWIRHAGSIWHFNPETGIGRLDFTVPFSQDCSKVQWKWDVRMSYLAENTFGLMPGLKGLRVRFFHPLEREPIEREPIWQGELFERNASGRIVFPSLTYRSYGKEALLDHVFPQKNYPVRPAGRLLRHLSEEPDPAKAPHVTLDFRNRDSLVASVEKFV